MTTDKLPEWPELPTLAQPLTQFDVARAYHQYEHAVAEAALARMKALVEYAQHTGAWCGQNSGHACTCGLSELLAACERSYAAQPSGAGRRES